MRREAIIRKGAVMIATRNAAAVVAVMVNGRRRWKRLRRLRRKKLRRLEQCPAAQLKSPCGANSVVKWT
jgi:hypothetical protein